jgi:aspartate aminotransferase-like enzyme
MKEILFTVGPVEMYPDSLAAGALQLPYFRTPEFSEILTACERDMLVLTDAPQGSRALFLTCSGTGAMEAAIINTLNERDRAMFVRGGSFGERFGLICDDVGVPADALDIIPGKALRPGQPSPSELAGYSALLVNAHETSTGVLYDLADLGSTAASAGTLFIVDAISAFLCDPISMSEHGIDVLITTSQKALSLAPGLSIVVLGPRALERAARIKPKSHYFSFGPYLQDGLRGQTPFTPAVGTLLQLRARLDAIMKSGAASHVAATASRAGYFRAAIRGLPFSQFAERPSNALTALAPTNGISAYTVYERLKSDYGVVVTPNGGALRDRVFRVGHMGNLCGADFDRLVKSMKEISA